MHDEQYTIEQLKLTMALNETNRITVKLRKGGWEVEITCAETQLKQAIESVLSSLKAEDLNQPAIQSGALSDPANKTCRGLILDLWQESWFSENRSLSEVHEEIARRGYHYDRTAVAHSLTDLVRENKLTREGNARNYTYVQKRPAEDSRNLPIQESEKAESSRP